MKRIGFTTEELEKLETALINYGNVVTFDQLNNLFNEDRAYLRKRVSKLVQEGWLKRVKKGVYVISDLRTRGKLSISHIAIVNVLVSNSYVSFENSLQHHGFYDQFLNNVNSISMQQYKRTTIDGITYNFINSQKKYFYGWDSFEIDGQSVKIAKAEKALIDMIQFHRSLYSTDLVIEKMLNYQNDLKLKILLEYAQKSNLTTQRIVGFILDIAKLDSSKLENNVSNKKSVSTISKSGNKIYNNKWNLYYDSFFSKYLHG